MSCPYPHPPVAIPPLMRVYLPSPILRLVLFLAATSAMGTASAQHADVEFVYANQKIEIAPGPYGPVATGRFTTSGIFQQYDTNPGLASEVDTGGGLGPGDQVVYHVLGELRYWNGAEFTTPESGVQVRIENN